MATVLIHAGAAQGFITAALAGRKFTAATVAAYAAAPNNIEANAAAFAGQVVTAAGTAIALADADTVYMEGLVAAVAAGMLMGSELGIGTPSTAQTAALAVIATAVAACAKANVAAM